MTYGHYPSILFLSEAHPDRGNNFRLQIYQDALYRRGVSHQFEKIPSYPKISEGKSPKTKIRSAFQIIQRIFSSLLTRIKRRPFDCIVLYRIPQDELFTTLLFGATQVLSTKPRLILDLDSLSPEQGTVKTLKLMKKSSKIVVSLPHYARPALPHPSVHYVQTAVDTVFYSCRHYLSDRDNENFIGMYLLHQSDVDALEKILPILVEVEAAIPFTLSLIVASSLKLPPLSNLPVKVAVYDQDDRPSMSLFEFALAPPSTRYEQGTYHDLLCVMALGISSLVPFSHAISTVLEHEKQGIVYHNEQELGEWLKRLLNDRPLRQRLGSEARERVVKNFSKEVVMPHWFDVIVNKTPSIKNT